LRSGDIYQVAEVVAEPVDPRARARPVRGREADDHQGPADPVSELTYATGGGEEKAEAMIDKVLDESHGARVMAEA
jgi:hypothetical protein